MEIYENKIHLTIRQGDLHVNTEHINDDNQQTLSLSFGRWFKGDVGPIGPSGLDGNDGKDAQINGRNAIVIAAGENISITDIEDGIQIAANGGALFLAEVNEDGTQLITPFDDILEAYNNGNVVYLKMPFFGVFVLAPLVAINNDLNMIVFDAHLATPDIHLDGALACTSDGQVEFHTYLPNWNEIQNKPTKLSEFENDTQFITEQSLEGYATESWVTKQHYLTEHQDISNKADKSEIPTKISQLNNDSNFIKNTVNNLTNYYTKTNTYTKSEVEDLIAAINQFHYEIVTVLPTTGVTNVLYLKGPIGDGSDKYEEYVYANGTFVKIGDTSIDLSGYLKDTDFIEYTEQEFMNLMNSQL